MAEKLSHTPDNEVPTELTETYPFPHSLDQYTRVEDKDNALKKLVKNHPTTPIQEQSLDNETGRLLYDRAFPADQDMFVDNPYNLIVREIARGEGRRPLDEVIDAAQVTIEDVQKALDPTLIEAVRSNGEEEEIITQQIKEAPIDGNIPTEITLFSPALKQHIEAKQHKKALPQAGTPFVSQSPQPAVHGFAD